MKAKCIPKPERRIHSGRVQFSNMCTEVNASSLIQLGNSQPQVSAGIMGASWLQSASKIFPSLLLQGCHGNSGVDPGANVAAKICHVLIYEGAGKWLSLSAQKAEL